MTISHSLHYILNVWVASNSCFEFDSPTSIIVFGGGFEGIRGWALIIVVMPLKKKNLSLPSSFPLSSPLPILPLHLQAPNKAPENHTVKTGTHKEGRPPENLTIGHSGGFKLLESEEWENTVFRSIQHVILCYGRWSSLRYGVSKNKNIFRRQDHFH